MQRLFENSTLILDYAPELSLIKQQWFGNLSEEQYKENMLTIVKWEKELPRIRFHIVYPNLGFPITPDLQEWTRENVFFAIEKEKRLEKAAFIVPPEVFKELVVEFLSVEQVIDESLNLFETRYFTNEEEAYKWFQES